MSTMVTTQPELALTPDLPIRLEVTPEALLAMPYEGHYELVDGQLKERKVSALSNLIGSEFNRILGNYARELDLGWLFAADDGYRCFPCKLRQIPQADVAFIPKERYSWADLSEDGYTPFSPDLAVEVVSPNDGAEELADKVREYITVGLRLVWIIYPNTRSAQVIRGDKSGNWVEEGDEFSGEDVLPGFRYGLVDFFPKNAQSRSDEKRASAFENR